VRQTIFPCKNTKGAFVTNFVQNLVQTFGNPQAAQVKYNCILGSNKIFREVLKLITKFQFNFGLRSVVSTEVENLADTYIQGMYNFSMYAYRSTLQNKQSIMTELMAQTNVIWQKFSWETTSLKMEIQQKVEGFVAEII